MKKLSRVLLKQRHVPIIGIEIHAQLKSAKKLFSVSDNVFGVRPNSCVSELDAGLPGALPALNREPLKLALRSAMALRCEIDRESWFDRKHYFYPDMPLGYQITQQQRPFAKNGLMEITTRLPEIHTTTVRSDDDIR